MPSCRRASAAVSVLVALALGLSGCRAVQAQAPTPARQLEDAIQLMETRGDVPGAVTIFEQLSRSSDRAVAARALLFLGSAYEKLGRAEARRAYEQIIREFPDQPHMVAAARARLAEFGRAASPRRLTPTVRRPWDPDLFQPMGPPTPDGRYLPGVDWNTGNLVLRPLPAGNDRVVTAKEAWDDDGGGYPGAAIVAPDGSRVAYTWYPSDGNGGEFGELRVSGLNGGSRRVLRRVLEEYIALGGWTPDGTKVLACLHARDWRSDLALIDVKDGRTSVLASFRDRMPNAALSPDGRFVAYGIPSEPDGYAYDIHVIDAVTGQETARLVDRADERFPVWLADSRHLLFSGNRAGSTGLWMTQVENGVMVGEPVLLKSDLGRAVPTGVDIAGTFYYEVQSGLSDIFTSSLDGATGRWTPPKMLPSRLVGSNYMPAFSPDGRSLAYISRRGDAGSFNDPGTQAVVVHDLNGGEERAFLPKVRFPIHPRWSPDGRSIAIVGNIQSGVYTLDIASGDFTEVVQQPRGPLFGRAEWSGDGRSIYYGAGSQLRRHDLAAGADAVEYVAQDRQGFGYVVPSHDGRLLAFAHASGTGTGLYVTTAPFAKPKAVLALAAEYRIQLVGWSQDDSELIYSRAARSDRTNLGELWRVPVAGGTPRSLGLAVRGLSNPAVSPDGRTVAFNLGSLDWETWVLERIVPSMDDGKTRRARKGSR